MDPLTIMLGIGAYELISRALDEDSKERQRLRRIKDWTDSDIQAMQAVTDQAKAQMRHTAAQHYQQFSKRVKH
ncbi:hypothetical protein [Nitrolancea hollandica]|uniref:Uncharacterized protein n=1 Tax=Nitrolancea hollandica Lb TaxID=1129897 RepID=I4ELB0_9BACT|nr:hypothetical protein [Nitrolancea hollandica]CCF85472.1 hypothetical protein NITHO_500007 [Nitrolancea hollandica Lb]